MMTYDFLTDIIENPADDTPRKVYADWLEENAGTVECGYCERDASRRSPWTAESGNCRVCLGKGHVSDGKAERAEFIRVQCELAKLRAEGCHEGKTCNVTGQCAECLRDVKAEPLRRRERELLEAHGNPWLRFLADLFCGTHGDTIDPHHHGYEGCTAGAQWKWRRGFVAEVALTLADWCGAECIVCENGKIRIGFGGRHGYGPPINCPVCHGTGRTGGHGPALVQATPLERVTLSDRAPQQTYQPGTGDMCWWWNESSEDALVAREHFIPTCLFKFLRTGIVRTSSFGMNEAQYMRKEDAEDDFSQACLAWAKSVKV